jgi:hypothetical protein
MKKVILIIGLVFISGIVNATYNTRGDEENGNYATFENDGTLVFKGTSTVWEDLRLPLTQTRVSPVTDKPDFDEANIGFLFPDGDTSEILYGALQIPHAYEEGTSLRPHVHWLRQTSDTCAFKMDYMWTNIDSATTTFTTVQVSNLTQGTFTSDAIHDVSTFPLITGTGKTISSILLFRLYRDGSVDDIVGDVVTYEIDFHYISDTLGSRLELTK